MEQPQGKTMLVFIVLTIWLGGPTMSKLDVVLLGCTTEICYVLFFNG